jgi:hypothetical protein
MLSSLAASQAIPKIDSDKIGGAGSSLTARGWRERCSMPIENMAHGGIEVSLNYRIQFFLRAHKFTHTILFAQALSMPQLREIGLIR